ncbi:MAG: gliding motility-associated C-terminal domain-containing protein, partial [Flavobacteriales bacterium]
FDGSTSFTYTAATPGNYDAVIVQDDCDVTVTFEVNDVLLPDVELGPAQTICEGQSASLDAGTVASWNTGANGQTIAPQTAGEYVAEFEQEGCFERDTVEVIVVEPPLIELGADTLFCEGQTIELHAQAVGTWNSGEVDDRIQVALPGMYRIDVIEGPCLVVDSIHVEQLPLPFVSLGEDPVYCEGSLYELSALGEFADYYTWSTGDSTEMISVEESIDLAIEVGNVCGISNDSLHVVFEDCSVSIYMPTMFTPNGDGINDEYWPSVNNVASYQLTIYNRWGNEVFLSTDPGEPWLGDTMRDGYFVPNGVYDFQLVCRTSKGNAVERSGHILVVR